MQYLLTQDEFTELTKKKLILTVNQESELQELCTLAANHVPVLCGWDSSKPPEPWGCILNEKGNGHGYCDLCPAEKVCPYEGKEFSK